MRYTSCCTSILSPYPRNSYLPPTLGRLRNQIATIAGFIALYRKFLSVESPFGTNKKGLGKSPRPFELTIRRIGYSAARTQVACGPLSPKVSPKTTLSPSARLSMVTFFKAFS